MTLPLSPPPFLRPISLSVLRIFRSRLFLALLGPARARRSRRGTLCPCRGKSHCWLLFATPIEILQSPGQAELLRAIFLSVLRIFRSRLFLALLGPARARRSRRGTLCPCRGKRHCWLLFATPIEILQMPGPG